MTAWPEFYWHRSGPVGPTCPTCQTIHGGDAARAVGLLQPGGPVGYRSRAGGPLRATRNEAEADLCATIQGGAA